MSYGFTSYYKYLLASKNQYGVHSPFLYDYLTKGLKKQEPLDLHKLVSLRKELGRNQDEIQVRDFGAGSKSLSKNKRKIADISQKAGISTKRGKLLAKTTRYFQPRSILEIGTSLGLSTAYMVAGAPNARITTLEGCPATAGLAQENFTKLGLEHINIEIGEFNQNLDRVVHNQKYDLIFFDGNHQKEPTLDYFKRCLKAADDNSVFIFDDIHWSPEMETAWEEIKNHPQVTLSVDTFKWGLVFFHQGRAKEHFTIRL